MSENHIQVPDADRCAFCDYLAGRRKFTVLRRDSDTATLVTASSVVAGTSLSCQFDTARRSWTSRRGRRPP